MRYLTIFPETENVHLIKDVGMLPYSLYHNCGYSSTLACYKNGEYPYLHTEVKGLNLVFIRKIFRSTLLDGLWLIFRNSRKYDVVQTFHLRLRSLIWLYAFKLLRPSGKVYLKLDANERILEQHFNGFKGKFKAFLLRQIDMVSVENTGLQQALSQKWQRAIEYIPNGFANTDYPVLAYEPKKNIVLTVGRIGAPEKRCELLLEAFASFSPLHPDWMLELAGPVEASFTGYIEAYFLNYPELKEKVIFTGAIQDRKTLFAHYAEAKIFCLTSLWEGFPMVLVEAASAGCYIITSAISAAADITANETLGKVFPVNDTPALVEQLKTVAGDEQLLRNNCIKIQEYARASFSWKIITQHIDQLIRISR